MLGAHAGLMLSHQQLSSVHLGSSISVFVRTSLGFNLQMGGDGYFGWSSLSQSDTLSSYIQPYILIGIVIKMVC